MRKWTVSLLLVIVLATIAPATAQEPPDLSVPDLEAICQSAVEGMDALTGDLEWPEHLMEENAVKAEDDFDAAEYFTVLDHLSVEEGYFLDYVYLYDFMGGYPVLYTLPEDEEPFATFADYAEAVDVAGYDFPNYLDRVVIDGTPEGYLQMVVLDVMGSQFYLHWHANYNDLQVVCNDEMLEALLASYNEFGYPIPEDVQDQVRDLDTAPVVELDEDVARVQVVLFTKWGGFYRVTYTMSHEYPREVYTIESELLAAYDCGVMF
jgi:hypothetical protein